MKNIGRIFIKLLTIQRIYESSKKRSLIVQVIHYGQFILQDQKFLIYMKEVIFRNLYAVYVVAESSWEGGEILFIFAVHAVEGAVGTFCLMVFLMITSKPHLWALGLVSYR